MSARSFARIAESNLKKQGVLTLVFADPSDYERVEAADLVDILELTALAPGSTVKVALHHADGTTGRSPRRTRFRPSTSSGSGPDRH